MACNKLSQKLLVTGANGFVGKALVSNLSKRGATVNEALRSGESSPHRFIIGDISPNTDWSETVNGCSSVIHLAARVHLMQDFSADRLAEFRHINVESTLNLARQAAHSGVRRFIFVSSIKVNGEETISSRSYASDDTPSPADPYGISKHEAEIGLKKIGEETGLEIVIIRPVLVYGSGVKANFLSMMRWLNKGIPLPFGAIHNKRSLVALDNLVDLIVTCIDHPAAANQTFLVSDDDDMSTTELLQRMATALGKPARLLPVPSGLLKAGAALLGKKDVAQRLLGSLQVDISKTKEVLGWVPPVSVDEALKKTAEDFLARQK